MLNTTEITETATQKIRDLPATIFAALLAKIYPDIGKYIIIQVPRGA